MAGRLAQVMVETDDQGSAGSPDQMRGAPTSPQLQTLNPSMADLPPAAPRQPQQQQRVEPSVDDFEVIDAPSDQQQQQQDRQQQQDQQQQVQPQQTEEPDQPDQDQPTDQRQDYVRRVRRDKNQRMRDARDRSFAEINYLRGHVQQLESRLASYEPRFEQIDQARIQQQAVDLDRQIQDAETQLAGHNHRISEAITNGDGAAIAGLLNQRDQAIINRQQLIARKNVLTTGNAMGTGGHVQPTAQPRQPQQQQPEQPQPLSPRALRLIDEFRQEHDWINFEDRYPDQRIRDRDSRVLAMLDADVTADGFDPGTQEYWDELVERAQPYLPHRFGQSQQQQQQPRGNNQQQQPRTNGNGQRQPAVPPQRRGPMTAGGSPNPPASGRQQVYLTPERKLAMIQSGALESDGVTVADKAKFARQLKYYHEFDRANDFGVTRQ